MEPEATESPPKKVSEVVELHDGEALTWDAAQSKMRSRPCHLVVLAGAADSGKTTILTSLYELFLQAPVGGLSFSGSQSLMGFEKRCHQGRVDSGLKQAKTSRTLTSDGFRFLHLRLADGDARHELLLSDVSGEFFRSAAATVDGSRRLTFMPFASKLVLVLDGERVARPDLRSRALADVRMVFRGLLDAEMLSANTAVSLVLAKVDLLVEQTGSTQQIDELEKLKSQLSDLSESNDLAFSFLAVAARPESDILPFAHGVPRLLRAWLEEPPRPATQRPVLVSQRAPASERAWSQIPRAWHEAGGGAGYDLDCL